MSTPYYVPEESVPLPPADADVISTACDYCIVACGYKVYRWPVKGGKVGGPKAEENAFGEDFPVDPLGDWVAPNQHNIVLHEGEPHHVVIIPDKDTEFVNPNGNSSIRGGAIAQIDVQKIYTAAEWMAKPRDDDSRPKTSIMIEKGFYWSNNTGNTNAISSLGIICGCGGRPGQVIGRAGGHQRGDARSTPTGI